MTDIFLPSSIDIARVTWRYLDSTGISRNPYTGAVRTASLLGDRLGATLEMSPSGGRGTASGLQDRARIMQFIARMQGQQGRAFLYDASYVQRGSFQSAELLANNEFSSGITGWSTSAGNFNASSADNSFRATRSTAGVLASIITHGAITVSPYLAHAIRFFSVLGAGYDPSTLACRIDDATPPTIGSTQAWAALLTQVLNTEATTLSPRMVQVTPAAIIAGSYLDILYASMARCLLADNSPNLLQQSDTLDNAYWTKTRCSVTANATASPDGTTTAESIIEDGTATQTHLISSGALTVGSDTTTTYCMSACLKAGARTWAQLSIQEATGTTNLTAYFDLTNGVVGSAAVGANWAAARSYIVSLGNGWYRCSVIGRKTNAATSLTGRILLATANNVVTYSGDGTSNIYAWRAGMSISSQPFIPNVTTSAASSGTTPTGNSINVKSGDASISGALLPGDQFEILTSYGSELKIVTAPFDTDAAGCGTLFFVPRLRGTVSDGAAIIMCRPMGRFVYAGQSAMEWATDPGIITSASFDFEEAT